MPTRTEDDDFFNRAILSRPRIVVRERPLREIDLAAKEVQLNTHEDQLLAVNLLTQQGYMYDHDSFHPSTARQEEVFCSVGMEMVDVVMHGLSANCVILGSVNSGKTHTLLGTEPDDPGLLQRTAKELFDRLEQQRSSHSYEVGLRYWDVGRNAACDHLRRYTTTHHHNNNSSSSGDDDDDDEEEDTRCHRVSSADARCDKREQSTQDGVERQVLVRDAFGRLELGHMTEVPVRNYAECVAVLQAGTARRQRRATRRRARWHGFVQFSIVTTDEATGEVCVLRRMTFVLTTGVQRVSGNDVWNAEVVRESCATNASLTLLFAGMIHSLEYRERRMAHVRSSHELHELIRKSQSFFMGCRFSQIMSQLVSGHEACVVVACVHPLSYRDTIETLENVQLMRATRCACVPITTSSKKGRLLRRLRALTRTLTDPEVLSLTPAQLRQLARPVTEEEERVLHLRAAIEGWEWTVIRAATGLQRLRSAQASRQQRSHRAGSSDAATTRTRRPSRSSHEAHETDCSDHADAAADHVRTCDEVSEDQQEQQQQQHQSMSSRARSSRNASEKTRLSQRHASPLRPTTSTSSTRAKSSGSVNYATHGQRRKIYLDANKTATYEGQWANGLFDGFGEHVTPTWKYRGQFKRGQRCGEGVLYTRQHTHEPYTRVYDGEWLNDMRDGYGTEWRHGVHETTRGGSSSHDGTRDNNMSSSSSSSHTNGSRHTSTQTSLGSTDVYEGEFVANERHGQGIWYMTNGDVVEGSFRRGRCEGWAVLRCANGDWYEGEWLAGQREGSGTWHYVKLQRCMHGEWVANMPRLGTIEDDDAKENCEGEYGGGGFIPRVGLCNWQAVLARERERVRECRSRERNMTAHAAPHRRLTADEAKSESVAA